MMHKEHNHKFCRHMAAAFHTQSAQVLRLDRLAVQKAQ